MTLRVQVLSYKPRDDKRDRDGDEFQFEYSSVELSSEACDTCNRDCLIMVTDSGTGERDGLAPENMVRVMIRKKTGDLAGRARRRLELDMKIHSGKTIFVARNNQERN